MHRMQQLFLISENSYFLVHLEISNNIFIRKSEIQFESVALYFLLNLMTIPFHTVPTKPQEDYYKYIWEIERNTVDIVKEIGWTNINHKYFPPEAQPDDNCSRNFICKCILAEQTFANVYRLSCSITEQSKYRAIVEQE